MESNLTGNIGCGNVTWEQIRSLYEEIQKSDQAGDATWILTSAFIVFTMQSGFGLLEAGTVSAKNETNIMIKNAVDVIFGALGYWFCGFAFSFGDDEKYSNSFTGFGHFFTDTTQDDEHGGALFARYFFQLSFATTATTIVSGAMAERTNLKAYMFFSFINLFSYVFPAHWIWAEEGVFHKLGVVDVAGCGPVHAVGGTSALIASIMLKPRTGVFVDGKKKTPAMSSPTNVILGTFMLWWGWLGFNCGSTFGVSGGKWKLATRAAVTTINASTGAGLWGLFYCYFLTKKFDRKLDVGTFTACILGGLVSITAICAICNPWEALLIGAAGGVITVYGIALLDWLQIDDPVSSVPVHCFCGVWGMLCCGLFGEKDTSEGISKYRGVVKGGPWSFLGWQTLAAVSIVAWAALTSALELLLANLIFGLRVSAEEERLGADYCEHGISLLEEEEEEELTCNQSHDRNPNIKFENPEIVVNQLQTSKENDNRQRRQYPIVTSDGTSNNKPVFYQYDISKTFKYGYASSSVNTSRYCDASICGNDNLGFSYGNQKPIYTIGAASGDNALPPETVYKQRVSVTAFEEGGINNNNNETIERTVSQRSRKSIKRRRGRACVIC